MKTFFSIIAASLLLFACDNKEKEMEEKVSQLQAQNAALQEETQEKDAALSTFMESFNEIEKNLREIRAREMNIELTSSEKKLSSQEAKARVQSDIQQIDSLIAQNRSTIQRLNVQLRNSNNENVRLNNSMTRLKENLTGQVDERETRVENLLSEIDGMEIQVDELRADVDSLQTANEKKLAEINSAYYVAGDFKALQDEEILDKEGGFLGFLGRTETLTDDFAEQDKFTKINIRETVFFPIKGKDVELVTTHPKDSYKIEASDSTDQMNLVISDPDRFWESSKYMVAVTKGS